jgi:hypothetical protein
MSAVSEAIVREYFELHGFFVRQQRKYVSAPRREDDEIDFLVWNPSARGRGEARPFVLDSSDLSSIARAMVVVKGWHTETFSPGVLAHAPGVFRCLSSAVLQQAARSFGKENELVKILVAPALPSAANAREQSITLLRSKGIDAVIPFRSMLLDLIRKIEVNRNYQKSDLLQVLRILKNYELFREPQLELFRPKRARREGAP